MGAAPNYTEALRLFKLAAAHGSLAAVQELTMAFYKGRGVPQDLEEAVRWARIGAERGSVRACHSLALFAEAGEGMPHSPAEALRAAQMGLRIAASAEKGAGGAPAAGVEGVDVAGCHYMAGKMLATSAPGVAKDERAALRHFEAALRLDPASRVFQQAVMLINAQIRGEGPAGGR